ncbi:DUF1326 domain-containing protein [Arthrobacter sunyaminii]|uniref:DUF1326 domain-containing protein n=1 Tax=Arthrobacter sunyaminii TaxID=2816859 RepID=A0A975S661_9MICC|nr:DUF1326 domain-containing protein [Arthrobacter sunyaminii]MBO0909759.1 DUF1326 domain-containing protein [Arthrobacter sunyaminii]QWQ36554.1 DUF1326 domain-containing protein [Arthrobacter sunyaminii]
MEYTLTGNFLEACDCTVICPCWVDDDPVEGHCTGFVLWEFTGNGTESKIDGLVVTGCKVVSVAIHAGKRRDSSAPATSMIYIDVSDCKNKETTDEQLFQALRGTFAEHPTKKGGGIGPLAELAEMSGTVVGAEPAMISFELEKDGPADKNEHRWTATVTRTRTNPQEPQAEPLQDLLIHATGQPERFDVDENQNAKSQPLELSNTALTYELQAQNPVTAQAGDELIINVGALPGGNINVKGRSGMRGTFHYRYPAAGVHTGMPGEEAPAS